MPQGHGGMTHAESASLYDRFISVGTHTFMRHKFITANLTLSPNWKVATTTKKNQSESSETRYYEKPFMLETIISSNSPSDQTLCYYLPPSKPSLSSPYIMNLKLTINILNSFATSS